MTEPTEPTCGNCVWFDVVREECDDNGQPWTWYGCRNSNSRMYGGETSETDTCDQHEPAETQQ